MAVRSYPLDRDAFFGRLPVWGQEFFLGANLEVSGLGDGSILVDEIGPRLWRGRVEIDSVSLDEGREIEALLALLQGPGRSFLIWPLTRHAPSLDPDGTLLSGSSPVIAALPGDPREISIGGLPAGYVLSPGDMLSFTYGTTPTRYALHRVASDPVTADGTGTTPPFEVVPALRPGAAVGAPVDLVRPCCKAIVVPGSLRAGSARKNRLRGLSFDFIQTLR